MKYDKRKISIVFIIILAVVLMVNTFSNDVQAAELLKIGSSGQQVEELQKALKDKGYFTYPYITGYYGNITKDAVMRFQRDCNITVDGIAGSVTLARLYATTDILKKGSSGWQVTQLQQKLTKTNFFEGPITGYFGDITENAVRRFQWNYGLKVDGIVGSNTYNRLDNYDGDIFWLARIIQAEASGESYEGKLAVGNVVMNRVRSDEFPDTIYGVIFEYYNGIPQFTPVANGTIYNNPSSESYAAARQAYSGSNNIGSALFFFNSDKATASWIVNTRKYAGRIGNHVFYY